ncbi:MAG: hypothetical protein RL701_2522, partial [Pseudomonadota bacterium]
MGEFDDVIAEFLIESREGLDQLDRDLVALEETPDAKELLARIFRCFHTVKGTSGFLGFGHLERLTHAGENLLSKMRDGQLRSSSNITTSLLETVDAVRYMLGEVEASGNDGDTDYTVLTEQLHALCRGEEPAQDEHPAPARHAPAQHIHSPVEEHEPEPEPEVVQPATAAHEPVVEEPVAAAEAAHAEKPAAHGGGGETHERAAAVVPENVRVDLTLLDKLVDLAGELVLTRNHIVQLAKGREDAVLASATQRLNFVTAQLQDGIMRMRMQPISNLFSKFPRVVRDLARSCRKLVR